MGPRAQETARSIRPGRRPFVPPLSPWEESSSRSTCKTCEKSLSWNPSLRFPGCRPAWWGHEPSRNRDSVARPAAHVCPQRRRDIAVCRSGEAGELAGGPLGDTVPEIRTLSKDQFLPAPTGTGEGRFPLCRRWSNSRTGYGVFWKPQQCSRISRGRDKTSFITTAHDMTASIAC